MQAARRLVREVVLALLSTGRAVLLFAIVYGLLSVPWPGLQQSYSKAFRWAGQAVFHDFGPRGVVKFLPLEKPTRTADSEIGTGVRGIGWIGYANFSPRFLGFLPSIEIFALILASSVAWRRRLFSLVVGLVAIHLFIYLRLFLLIHLYYCSDNPWQQYHPTESTLDILTQANEILNISPTAGFVVPVLIWIAVTFRASDWERIIRRQQHETAPAASD